MNTTRLKTFATEARNTLRRGVMNRLLALGFDQDGNVVQEPTMFEGGAVVMGETISEDFYNKWISLRDRIASHSLREVLEEAAYTWFNRLMAIRIMQKNGLIAVISNRTAKMLRTSAISVRLRAYSNVLSRGTGQASLPDRLHYKENVVGICNKS